MGRTGMAEMRPRRTEGEAWTMKVDVEEEICGLKVIDLPPRVAFGVHVLIRKDGEGGEEAKEGCMSESDGREDSKFGFQNEEKRKERGEKESRGRERRQSFLSSSLTGNWILT